jgi:hypothetical protein
MTAPHVPSDNAAIEAAHAKIRETADLRLLTVVAEFIARPARYNREKVLGAMQAVEDEHYTEMERALGRAPGSLGRPSGGDERGSFAGLTRGFDGSLEPERNPHGLVCMYGGAAKPCLQGCGETGWCKRTLADNGGVTVATVPANKALRDACRPMRECKNHSGGPEGSW